MYSSILFAHSWLRWIILFLLLFVLINFSISLLRKKSYTNFDRVLSSCLLGAVHLQFILGLGLYFFLSPIVKLGLANMSTTMATPPLRYWTVEHISSMFIFTLLVQLGFSFSKRATQSDKKHRLMFGFCLVSFILLMATIPWPVYEYGRALFRL